MQIDHVSGGVRDVGHAEAVLAGMRTVLPKSAIVRVLAMSIKVDMSRVPRYTTILAEQVKVGEQDPP